MDSIEYELRILDINIADIERKLLLLGAKKNDDYFFKRYVFETIPPKKGRWIRLRTDGDDTTLTVKQISSNKVDGTYEKEIKISNFDVCLDMLKMMGFKPKSYQESKRSEYLYKGVQISIDVWPNIPPFLGLEAVNENTIRACVEKLGYTD